MSMSLLHQPVLLFETHAGVFFLPCSDFQEVRVKSSDSFEVEVTVDVPNSIICWEFRTEDMDLGFMVKRRPILKVSVRCQCSPLFSKSPCVWNAPCFWSFLSVICLAYVQLTSSIQTKWVHDSIKPKQIDWTEVLPLTRHKCDVNPVRVCRTPFLNPILLMTPKHSLYFQDQLIAKEPAVYCLVFDNSHSFLRDKKLKYMVRNTGRPRAAYLALAFAGIHASPIRGRNPRTRA
jgi:hypothetical protein